MRWYHKFETGFTGLPPKMARIRNRNHSGDWHTNFCVHFWIEDDMVVADIQSDYSTQANSTGWLPKTIKLSI